VPRLLKKERTALKWAVENAAGWRGYYIGNPDPDPEPLRAFDARLRVARRAIRVLYGIERRK
jgi:hypothetical protein